MSTTIVRRTRTRMHTIFLIAIIAACPARAEEYAIHFKAETVRATAQSPEEKRTVLQQATTTATKRLTVQFRKPLDGEARTGIESRGLELQTYLGDNAYFARINADRLDIAALADEALIVRLQPISPVWKLDRMLAERNIPPYAVVSPPPSPDQPEAAIIGAYVLFHPDIPLAAGVNLAARHGAFVRDRLRSVNGLVMELPLASVFTLAAEDEVLWMEPPLPQFEGVNDSNRALVGANVIQQAPYNLNGAGVRVLVYDAGLMSSNHPDLQGRIVNSGDTSGVINHATHVGGTVGGSGAASNGTFRGMAPGVEFVTYGFQWNDANGIFLYANPGDIELDYGNAIQMFSADISNNSIGTNTCWNNFPCNITGNYGVTDQLIDSIVTGFFGAPFRVVWANGNERDCPFCPGEHTPQGYHSTAPPACAKNHLTVGAVHSNNDAMTSFSSWGPCDDGRMKPDVVAPGCQSNMDGGVTSCSSFGGYDSLCGTSMAAPTACGLGAILLQDFRAQYPDRPDFRNSTLRVLLAHSASDWGPVGPDYQSGFGSIRIQPAVEFLRSGNFLQAEVGQDEEYSVLVIVNPGDPAFKVTLAWDDPPAAPLVANALINDLDLVVLNPAGEQVFPWTLDPMQPGNPAVRTQPDRRNNIEQVFMADPTPGVWRVFVRGFNVPQGPQTFSIGATPTLVNCSTRGVISLDRPKYACGNTAVIQVVDCDLNTNEKEIETVNIFVASSLEPDGEVITLEESGGATSLFRGMITLSTTNQPGTLHVDDGVTILARYVDADDGFGGQNVNVEIAALVDCVPPAAQSVETINILPFNATVRFTTNEPARGSIRYGLACNNLNLSTSEAGFSLEHYIVLSGLAEDTVYFYAVDLVDAVGNPATFNAGGACYAFGTTDIPDFFTHQIAGPSALQFRTVDFTPVEGIDRYHACNVAITALPTDPTGGTVLPLPNNGSLRVDLADNMKVSLYGTEYPGFWVGSNGYLTFTEPDNDSTESFADHFDTPRVSGLFDNLSPALAGSVSWLQLPNRAVVTWENVPDGGLSTSNTFQIEMYYDGRITLSYLSLSTTDGIVGLSDGTGVSPYFSTSNLADYGVCGPRPPRARRVDAVTVVDTPVTVTLLATDDGLPDPPGALEYLITQLPVDGTLSDPNAGPIVGVPYTLVERGDRVVYTPNPGEVGPDNFRYAAHDGGVPPDGGESGPASVLMVVHLDCNLNGIGDPFDLANGTSIDCNLNAIPDECDIATGQSHDCESDGTPDECQSDCNDNGISDSCDIASGASNDCNGNAVPDECDLAAWSFNFFETVFDPPMAIAETGTTQVNFTVNAGVPVVDVNVHVDIAHDNVGDLWVSLRHSGLSAVLIDRCGGAGDNYTGTVLDDEAITPICDGTPPFTGVFQPDRPLTIFDGQNMQGVWTLLIRDTAAGHAGALHRWVLHLPVGSPDCNVNLVPDDCEPDCNNNHRADECDIADGVSQDRNGDGIPDECTPVIVASYPPHRSIDARQPMDLNGANPQGWRDIELTFSGDPGPLTPADFTVTATSGAAPGISSISLAGSNMAVVHLDAPIPAGAWTRLTHNAGAGEVCLGFLPADASGDGVAGPIDILRIIDCLNMVALCTTWQSDIDRSGLATPADVLRLIDLLNGADAFDPWNGQFLPPAPCP